MIGTALLATQSFGDSAGADRLATEARTFADRGDFVTAAAKYREAFSQDPRPDLMCNVGVAYYKAKNLPKAQRYLDQCLSIGTSLDRGFIDSVKKVLVAVETALAGADFTPVDLLVQPSAATTSIEGGVPFDEPILGSRRVWFPFGRYKLIVHAEGHVDRTIELDANARTARPLQVSLERAPIDTGSAQGSAVGSAQETGSAQVSAGSAEIRVERPVVTPIAKPSMLPPVIVSTASVGLGAVGLLYFLAALDSAEKAGAATDFTVYSKHKDDALDRQKMSWLFTGLAGAGAVVSGILWYRYANAPRVEVQASGDGAAISIEARW